MSPAAAHRIAVENRLKSNRCSHEHPLDKTLETDGGGKTAELKSKRNTRRSGDD
jgi:hypothetical protein